jgi:putative transcriptional regulator
MDERDFERLLKSIKQGGEILRGERKPSRVFHVEPLNIKDIRKKLKVSQPEFARMIGVSAATLRNWEQGRTYPDGAARALLRVAAKRPDAILDALRAA